LWRGSDGERIPFHVVLFVEFRDLIVRVHDPLGGMCARRGGEWPDIPFLKLACCNVVRPTATVVTIIVDIQIVPVGGLLSKILDTRNYVE